MSVAAESTVVPSVTLESTPVNLAPAPDAPDSARLPSPAATPEPHQDVATTSTNTADVTTTLPVPESGITPLAPFVPEMNSAQDSTPQSTAPSQVVIGENDVAMPDAGRSDPNGQLATEPISKAVPVSASAVTEALPAVIPSTEIAPVNVASLAESSAHVPSEGKTSETTPAGPGATAEAADTKMDSAAPVPATVPVENTTLGLESSPLPPTINGDSDLSNAQGVVRSREGEELSDEPVAKRTKTEDAPDAVGEFKKPELPSAAHSLPPVQTDMSANNDVVNGDHGPRFSNAAMTPVQKKILEEKMKNTKKTKHAISFLRPVDPMALNIPTYTTIVTSPMDLGTVEQKLKSDQYRSLDDFVNDFELIINNCYKFNGPHHLISQQAQALRAYFMKQMETVPTGDNAVNPTSAIPKAATPVVKSQPRRESKVPMSATSADTFPLREPGVPQIRRDSTAGRPQRAVVPPTTRDPSYSIQPKKKSNQVGLKFCDHVLAELRKPSYSRLTGPFLLPVDPIALRIPNYGKIVKEPMDLQTITDKQQRGFYSTADECKADLDLMLNNCFKFNPPGDEVNNMGKKLEQEINALWKEKSKWIKTHQPQSHRDSPVSDDESESEVSEDDEEDKIQLEDMKKSMTMMQAHMQSLIDKMERKRKLPKIDKKKKKKSSMGGSKSAASAKGSKKSLGGGSSKSSKSKSSKARKLTHAEASEITEATGVMSEEQMEKLSNIIYADGHKPTDGEVEIEELRAETQQKLLRYVRTIVPQNVHASIEDDFEDDYAPRSGGAGDASRKSSSTAKKKRKPMKADEQTKQIAELKSKMESFHRGGVGAGEVSAIDADEQTSDEESSESEEE